MHVPSRMAPYLAYFKIFQNDQRIGTRNSYGYNMEADARHQRNLRIHNDDVILVKEPISPRRFSSLEWMSPFSGRTTRTNECVYQVAEKMVLRVEIQSTTLISIRRRTPRYFTCLNVMAGCYNAVLVFLVWPFWRDILHTDTILVVGISTVERGIKVVRGQRGYLIGLFIIEAFVSMLM